MRKSAFACFLMVAGFALSAQAAFVGHLIDYQGGLNTVYATGLAGVYDENKQKKSGYQWNGLNVNDIVVVVLKATKVDSAKAPGGIVDSSYEGELTKYLALQIASVGSGYYTFKAGISDGWDPFGKLKKGEVMAIWLDGEKDFTVGHPIYGNKNNSRQDEVDWATDGLPFATFGLDGQDFRGYFSSPFSLTLWGGLVVKQNPLGLYWLGVPNPLGGTADLAIHNLSLGDDATSNTDWDAFASDAERFRVTPEPGTITALLAMGGAAGLGLALRRRKES
jgi:hypothetical protein